MTTVRELEVQLITHEAIGAEQYATLIKRIDRLEMIIIGTASTLIVGMAGIIITIILKGV